MPHPRWFSFSVAAALCWQSVGPVRAADTRKAASPCRNVIRNGDFQAGQEGGLPQGWRIVTARPALMPVFALVKEEGRKMLLATGEGNPDCVGYATTLARITLGKTYLFRVLFRCSDGMNPQENLLFKAIGPAGHNGIVTFRRLGQGWAKGEERICWPGQGQADAEIRLYFRLSAHGRAWIREVSLAETDPVLPRWARIACTSGKPSLQADEAVLDEAGRAGVDIALLPEYMQGGRIEEPLEGPSYRLMSAKAKQYRMYVAGGMVRKDEKTDRVYNTALLLDRDGRLVGTYDKIHPYSPEINEEGITPGSEVRVFRTDFAAVGLMICYDSWIPDVAQLLSLKGAEIILFPNAGHQPEVLYARSMDNAVRIVNSSWNLPCSIHDTLGRNIRKAADYETSASPNMKTFKDLVERGVPGTGMKILIASLDLNCSPSPAYNGGTMMSAPGNRRNRFEQKIHLEAQIQQERDRWWSE